MTWMPRRLRGKALLAYAPALLITAIAALLVNHAFGLGHRYSEEVLESTRLIARTNELRTIVATAQSSVRGFAISGEDRQLEAYRFGEHELGRQREVLGSHWDTRPAQREALLESLELFFRWRDEVAEPVIEARRPPEQEVAPLIARGQPIMDRVSTLLGQVVEQERARLQVRTQQSEQATRWGRAVAIGAPLLALAYVLVVSLMQARRTADTVEAVARAAEDVAAGDLSRRVRVYGTDELGAMASTFNAMAERLAQRTAEAERLIELAQLLQVTLSSEEVGRLFEHFVPRLVPATGAGLALYDAQERCYVPLAAWGLRLQPFPATSCWAARLGKVYYSSGGDGPPCEHWGDLEGRCAVCVPMVVHGETLGLIGYSYEPDAAGRTVRGLGVAVAERFAFTLSNLVLRERLREQSIRDPLTGLFNRRSLDETLEREIERARRSGEQVGVLFVDIDHFKELNDASGHDAGDAVLREFGALLQAAFRRGDESYRYGGEEFVVLMPRAGLEDVMERAAELRERLRGMRVTSGGKPIGPITVSMGASSFPTDGLGPADVLRAADLALQRAKEGGRNRIVAAGAGPQAMVAGS